MPPSKAEAYLKQLMQSYWNKKTYDGSSSDPSGGANIYNPQSMLDSYWFAKRAGGEGSDVELMQGGQNLGELKDLMYFVNKLYKSLKVPLSRLNPEDGYKDGSEILREEFLIPLSISAYRLSKDTGIPQTRISAIIKGNRRVTADTALRFSKYFGNSAKFWLGLQDDFDIEEENTFLKATLDAIPRFRNSAA